MCHTVFPYMPLMKYFCKGIMLLLYYYVSKSIVLYNKVNFHNTHVCLFQLSSK